MRFFRFLGRVSLFLSAMAIAMVLPLMINYGCAKLNCSGKDPVYSQRGYICR
jgi:hypothetical protein